MPGTAAADALKQFDQASSELDQTIPASRREDWSVLKSYHSSATAIIN